MATTTTKQRTLAEARKRLIFTIILAVALVLAIVGIISFVRGKESEASSSESSETAFGEYSQYTFADYNYSDSGDEEKADVVGEEEHPQVVWGADVSHWNLELTDDSEFLKKFQNAGGSFFYIQVGITADDKLQDYWETYALPLAKRCEEAGILYGFYFLTNCDVESERYMELWYITKLHQKIQEENLEHNHLPFVLDFESPSQGEDKTKHREQFPILLQQLEEEGITPVIYSSYREWHDNLAMLFPKEQEVWIADYTISNSAISPNQLLASIKDNQQVICWQYSNDCLALDERGLNTDGQALDRDVMPYNVWRYYNSLCPES